MSKSRKCGAFPWRRKWAVRQNKKEPRYFCDNCFHLFRTGKFSRNDSLMYDDVCPVCGAIGLTLTELAEEHKKLCKDYDELLRRCKEKRYGNAKKD